MDTTTVLLSLASGAIGGGITQLITFLRDRKVKKIEYISSQLKNLYSPLLLKLSENEMIINHINNIEAISDKIEISHDIDNLINVKNDFSKKIFDNNDEIVKIISMNPNYIQREHLSIFNNFSLLRLRYNLEYDKEQKKWKIPFLILRKLEPIQIIPVDFKKAITEYIEKKSKYLF